MLAYSAFISQTNKTLIAATRASPAHSEVESLCHHQLQQAAFNPSDIATLSPALTLDYQLHTNVSAHVSAKMPACSSGTFSGVFSLGQITTSKGDKMQVVMTLLEQEAARFGDNDTLKQTAAAAHNPPSTFSCKEIYTCVNPFFASIKCHSKGG